MVHKDQASAIMKLRRSVKVMAHQYDISFEDINRIKALWEKNRIYHEETSEYFGHAYRGLAFEDRMEKFKDYDPSTYRVSVYELEAKIVAYCISTAINGVGELESMHVEASQRGIGIGQALAQDHLKWMRAQKCSSIGVTVSQENVATIGFYKKLGFYPNTIFMQTLNLL